MKCERASDNFYSNCLTEAIRAKIKNPKNKDLHLPAIYQGWSSKIDAYSLGRWRLQL